jgi:oligopeptide transport system substrate-binding protein
MVSVFVRTALGDWSNPEYDSLLDQAARELDPEIRKDLYKQAEKILVEADAVIMPLFYYGAAIATRPYSERTFPAFGAPDIAKWRLIAADEPQL